MPPESIGQKTVNQVKNTDFFRQDCDKSRKQILS